LAGTLNQLGIGANVYAPGLVGVDIVSTADAAFVGTAPVAMVTGLGVYTNKPSTGALFLYDAMGGPTPLKALRVSNGNLEVLSADVTTVLQTLSDQGTPSWPKRRGQVQIVDTATTATVTLAPVEPDTAYFVQVTPVSTFGAPAAGAFTIRGVTKSAGSFVLSVSAAPGTGNVVAYDWLVYR
jgi:hypothetical protein